MRRLSIIILAILIHQSSIAQKIDGIWITNDLRQLIVNDTLAELDLGLLSMKCKVIYKNDTLTLRDEYYIDRDRVLSYDYSDYNFSYRFIGKDSLELFFLSKTGLALDQPDSVYNFSRKESIKKRPLKFKYLVYASTTCHGSCPKMKIRVNADKTVQFFGEKRTEPFIGSFKGKLSNKQMVDLLELLSGSYLDRFPKTEGRTSNAPMLGLTVNYNGKIMKYHSQFFPKPAWPLQAKLMNLHKEIELSATTEELEFEK